MTTLIIVIAMTIISLLVTHACYRLYKLNQQQTAKIASLQNQLAVLCAGAVGTDDRIIRFEQTLHQLKEQQHTLDLGMNTQQGYDHAIRLARKGASINQLIDNCNLSDEEAHLISRLHSSDHQAMQQELH
jgi:L-asparaginase II